MITITNTRGEVLELALGTSLSIDQENPLFNDADKFFQDITRRIN